MITALIIAIVIGTMMYAIRTTAYTNLVTKIGTHFPRVAVKLDNKRLVIESLIAIGLITFLAIKITSWFSNLHFPSLPSAPSLPSFSFQSFRDMEWARIGIWLAIIVASILVATVVIRLFMRKPPFFGLIKPTGKFISMMFIGAVGYTIFNWIWWSVEPVSFNKWFLSDPFWSMPIGFVFVGVVAKFTDGVSSSARTAVRIALALGLIILITGFVRNRNRVTEPTDGRYSTTSFGGNRTGSRRDFSGFDPVVKNYVTARFQSDPRRRILIDIAACESGFNHWSIEDPTRVLRSNSPESSATGVFQILSKTHGPDARANKLNLEVLSDNVSYAKILFDREGTAPWNESRNCWQNRSSGNSEHVATQQPLTQSVEPSTPSALPSDTRTTRVSAFEVRATNLWSDRITTGVKSGLMLVWGSKLPTAFKIMAIFNADTPQEYAEEFVVEPGKDNLIYRQPDYVRVRSDIETTVLFARMKPQRSGRY